VINTTFMPPTKNTSIPEGIEQFRQQFGRRLASLRKEKGLTQEKLASKLKVDPVYVAYLEGAKRSPSFNTLYKLSQILAVAPSDLFRF